RVADGVAEVQDLAAVRLARVGADHAGLDASASLDDARHDVGLALQDPVEVRLQGREQGAVGDDAVLDHLAEAGDVVPGGQGLQVVDVDVHGGRLVERADQVLP